MPSLYSIGALSQRSGVNVETIRYYEKAALLPAPNRGSNGYRQYDDGALEQLAFIRRGRELGFTIDEIRDLLALAARPDQPCAGADLMTQTHLADIEGKIRDLERMRAALVEVANCKGNTAAHCQLIRTLAHSGEPTR
jgi:DNA-binding transcriptional MerR regulator